VSKGLGRLDKPDPDANCSEKDESGEALDVSRNAWRRGAKRQNLSDQSAPRRALRPARGLARGRIAWLDDDLSHGTVMVRFLSEAKNRAK
jgi:hypothetical protein